MTPGTFEEWWQTAGQYHNARVCDSQDDRDRLTMDIHNAAWDAGRASHDEEVQASVFAVECQEELVKVRKRALDAEGQLASTTDPLNSWARESAGVAESPNESGVHALAGRLWDYWASRHHKQLEDIHGLREQVRQLREALVHGRDEVANPDFDSQGRQLPVDVERLAIIDAALAATQEKA